MKKNLCIKNSYFDRNFWLNLYTGFLDKFVYISFVLA
jgi:hypothetical protein